MSKQHRLYGMAFVGSLCGFVMLLTLVNHYNSNMEIRLQLISSQESSEHSVDEGTIGYAMTHAIQKAIEEQRGIIEKDIKGYHYLNGMNVTKLEDLFLKNGGRPLRSLVLSSWRSGSTFFGDALNAHPANYYHYEPLMPYGVVQIRGPPLAESALRTLKALLECDYDNMETHLNDQEYVLSYNKNLWRYCAANKKLCLEPRFLNGFCKLFPFQSMKILRLRLRLAEELLEDANLAVRLIFLVRDPRGITHSRKTLNWCLPDNKDCSDAAQLCSDMVADFHAAVELMNKFPTRFRVMRYEDFAMEPYKNTREMYNFYGLDFHQNVKTFLDTHTKKTDHNTYGTSRNSKATPFLWRSHLEFQEVEKIQRSCTAAMQYWGYLPAMNATHQENFNPITDYHFPYDIP